MLRGLVIALLAANAVFFAWSHGHLAAFGWPANTATEPQRLAQQIAPDAVVLLTPEVMNRIEGIVQNKPELAPY